MSVRTVTAACAAAVLGLAGCYKPGGPGYSDDTFTYYGLPHQPVTVTILDTRTGETVWSYEVAVGRQLTMSFIDDYAPENVMTPTKLTWQEFERGTRSGTLDNSILVPDRYSRRVDVSYRPQPEMPRGASAGVDAE